MIIQSDTTEYKVKIKKEYNCDLCLDKGEYEAYIAPDDSEMRRCPFCNLKEWDD